MTLTLLDATAFPLPIPFFSVYSGFLILLLGFLVLEGYYAPRDNYDKWQNHSDIQKLFYYFIVGLATFLSFSFIALPVIGLGMTSSPTSSILFANQNWGLLPEMYNLSSVTVGADPILLSNIILFLITPALLFFLVRKLSKFHLTENKLDFLLCVYYVLIPSIILSLLGILITLTSPYRINIGSGLLTLNLQTFAQMIILAYFPLYILILLYAVYDGNGIKRFLKDVSKDLISLLLVIFTIIFFGLSIFVSSLFVFVLLLCFALIVALKRREYKEAASRFFSRFIGDSAYGLYLFLFISIVLIYSLGEYSFLASQPTINNNSTAVSGFLVNGTIASILPNVTNFQLHSYNITKIKANVIFATIPGEASSPASGGYGQFIVLPQISTALNRVSKGILPIGDVSGACSPNCFRNITYVNSSQPATRKYYLVIYGGRSGETGEINLSINVASPYYLSSNHSFAYYWKNCLPNSCSATMNFSSISNKSSLVKNVTIYLPYSYNTFDTSMRGGYCQRWTNFFTCKLNSDSNNKGTVYYSSNGNYLSVIDWEIPKNESLKLSFNVST